MSQDRPFAGILLMLGFCVLAPLGDGIAKLLGQTVPLGQLLLARFGIQAAVLLPLALATHRDLRMTPRVLRLTVLRTGLHIVGIGAMFLALRSLDLADAIAIAFVMPFLMLLLGKYVLGEDVGLRRLLACLVGFIGTLLVIQPNFTTVGAPALLPLLVAVTFALFMLLTRQIARETDPISLQAISGLMACSVLAPVLLLAPDGIADLGMAPVTSREAALLVAVGLVGTLAHLLMTWSLRFAPSATLAPMQYLEIPFSTLIGWLMFRDLPDGMAALGICITVSAGLYVVRRERMQARIMSSMPTVPPAT